LAGLGVGEVVPVGRLQLRERLQSRLRHLGLERQRLVRGDDAVAAEDRHEPRQPAGRHRVAQVFLARADAQCGEVEQALLVDVSQRIPFGVELGRLLEPLRLADRQLGRVFAERLASEQRSDAAPAHDWEDVDAGVPALARA